jgi:hypothetical protein
MAPLFRATVRYLRATAHRRCGIEICHFVAVEREHARLRATREIRERASLDVDREHMCRFIDRVGAEIRDDALAFLQHNPPFNTVWSMAATPVHPEGRSAN